MCVDQGGPGVILGLPPFIPAKIIHFFLKINRKTLAGVNYIVYIYTRNKRQTETKNGDRSHDN